MGSLSSLLLVFNNNVRMNYELTFGNLVFLFSFRKISQKVCLMILIKARGVNAKYSLLGEVRPSFGVERH